MAKLWSNTTDVSEGTKQNRRKRGSGTWGEEMKNLHQVERKGLRQRRGSGSWGTESKNLYRLGRRQERQERRNKNLLYRLIMG